MPGLVLLLLITTALVAEDGSPTISMANGWVFDGEVVGGDKECFSQIDLAVVGSHWRGRLSLRREHVASGLGRDEEGALEPRSALLPPVGEAPTHFATESVWTPGAPVHPSGWRGDGSGRFPDASAPDVFDPVWRVPLRSWTMSSAMTVADRDGRRLVYTLDDPHRLVCVDATSGTVLWARDNPVRLLGHRAAGIGYPRNDFVRNTYKYTTPTPVADAEAIYAVFGHGVVVSYDHHGRLRWTASFHTEAKMRSGVSISPVLLGPYLMIGGAAREAVAAYDRATGEQVWRQDRPGHKRGKGAHTALVIGDRAVVLMSTGRSFTAEGEPGHLFPELGNYGPSPSVQGDLVAFNTGTGLLHLGSLRRSEGAAAWRWQAAVEDSRSPIISGDHVYQPSGGDLIAFAIANGRESARIPTIGKWSSPALAGRAIVQFGKPEGGGGMVIQVVDVGDDGSLVERCRFATDIRPSAGGWDSGSSPVFDGDRLYFRGGEALWCLSCR